MFINVSPYCTDYKSAEEAKTAFLAGKDFILNNITSPWCGKPCSIRDFPDAQGFEIRFNQNRDLTTLSASEIKS